MPTKYRTISLGGQEISFRLRSFRRARHLRVFVYASGEILVTKPFMASENAAVDFLRSRSAWLLGQLAGRTQAAGLNAAGTPAEYRRHKEMARRLVVDRLQHFNQYYGFAYGRISIRNQRTRWGSCSKQSNLNFNYRLLFLKPEEADYIIVHELCHTREFNHSERFWKLVSAAIPEYRRIRRNLKDPERDLS